MIKKIGFALFVLLNAVLMQAQGIQFFEGKWKDALEKAKAEDKLLFVDAYAKWCGPCKAMAKNIFPLKEVGDYYNANFINLQIDMEEEDGITFGHKYPVSAYPTLFFIDVDGKVVKTIRGGQQAAGLIALGNEANKKKDRTSKYEQKYLEGDRDYDLVYNYVKGLNASGKPSLKISNDYLNSNPKITEDQKLKFILEAATEADSKLFDQVVANERKIKKIVGEEEFEEKCKSSCTKSVEKAIEYEMESLLMESIKKADKTFPDEAAEFAAISKMKYYKSYLNKDKYTEAYRALAKLSKKDPEMMKPVVADIVKSFKDDPKMMDDAEMYATKIYDQKQDMESLNNLCVVLINKNGREKAIKIVERAIEKGKKEDKDKREMDGIDALLRFLKGNKP
jgi:thioredoxin-related protein